MMHKGQIIMAVLFLVGTSSMGFAGQGMKSDAGDKNVPENIQRSTPSGETSLPSGSGPGSRADQLTEMEEVDSKNPNASSSDGKAAQAMEDLKKKSKDGKVSSQSSSKKSR